MTRTEHLLVLLMEECDEVSQRASKALRFGLGEAQSGQPYTNAERILIEYADLLAVVRMLVADKAFRDADLSELIEAKKAKVEHWLKYSAQCGMIGGAE